jgi:hypothetical protein
MFAVAIPDKILPAQGTPKPEHQSIVVYRLRGQAKVEGKAVKASEAEVGGLAC